MKRYIPIIAICLSLLAQASGVTVTASMTGTGSTINADITIPLAPSSITWVCTPALLQKGSTVSCVGTLDQPVPTGMTGTITLTAPANFTVAPATVTVAAGASTTPPVVVGRP
jgi:hypothetical protein